MADLLLSALIPIVMQKSADSLERRIGEMRGVDDLRGKLHDKLLAVQAVLADAEEKGDANPAVKSWLAKLKSAAYDADDVLDEFRYEELRRDAVKRGHKVGTVSGSLSRNPVLFRYKMSRKLREVVGRIDELVTEMERFRFVTQGREGRAPDRVRTHSYVIESEVIGREDDKEKLIQLLIEGCHGGNLMVLPVVGMGGLGKTTIAQLVYNDPRVKAHYQLLVWVCVSEEFDVGPLVKLIIDSVVHGDCSVPCDNMELLQRLLRQELGGKRYFLVLDDVWNENVDKWEQLRALLNCGDSGSTVVVTTRSGRVASIMGTVPSYNLGYLNDADSWSVFQRRAFGMGVQESRELLEIGRKLVENCGGLPLAIKTLGSLMSFKHEVHEWLAVLDESKIWENKHAHDGVLPVLRLSYDHLPPYMKQCFAFCAVFPKDYVMERDVLVHYWMAHGFIPSDGPGSLELKGSDIFNELVWRSFFQDVKQVHRRQHRSEHGYRSRTKCKMHDLMHDLAQSIMKDECLILLGPLQSNDQLGCKVRHISVKSLPMDINEATNCYPSMRSLILSREEGNACYVENIGFMKSNFIRIFDLCLCPIQKTMITPEKMKHLRYLNLSQLHMTELPEAITTLYLLQTLKLFYCSDLLKLPEGMRHMSNLRHLCIEKCFGLKCMPPGLGELKCLQTLTYYIVGTGVGNRLEELNDLNLCGQLELYNLREVRDTEDALKANLISKQNLCSLALCWGMPKSEPYDDFEIVDLDTSVASDFDPFEVLGALKPCNKLKVLRIAQYAGDRFPVWVRDHKMLENLIELYIFECRKCTEIPPIHKLPLLQILHLKYLDKLGHLCSGKVTSSEITFPSLKSMMLYEMPNLDSWYEGEVGKKTLLACPELKVLKIIGCPKLTAVPIVPMLEDMSVKGNKILSTVAAGLNTLRSLSLANHRESADSLNDSLCFTPWESLQNLYISGFNDIKPMSEKNGENMRVSLAALSLRHVCIASCNFYFSPGPSNSPLWFWQYFNFVEYLFIEKCATLVFWPEEALSNMVHLKHVEIRWCWNFLGLSEKTISGCSTATTQVLLKKLEFMRIWHCPNLVVIPKCSPSIVSIEIWNCKKLECLPDWLSSTVSLKVLKIESCESLSTLLSSMRSLTALVRFRIDDCVNLASLPDGMEGLQALECLEIIKCPKIKVLPEGLLQRLRSLNELWIKSCPELEKLFQKHGKYWPLISEIPLKKIGDGDRSSKFGNLTQLVCKSKISCLSSKS